MPADKPDRSPPPPNPLWSSSLGRDNLPVGEMRWFKNRRVVVTGAAGFIGTHLVHWLVDAGAFVFGVDRLRPVEFAGTAWVTSDLSGGDRSFIDECEPSVIFHLASIVGVRDAARDASVTRESIVETARVVLDGERLRSKPHIVFVSSSEVYGEARALPITEATPRAPRSAYGRAKAEAEELVRIYAQHSGSGAVIIRPFNVYGPGQRPEFVLPRFVLSAMANEQLRIVGDGLQVRTFTYIDDFVDGMCGAVAHTLPTGGTFNVAGIEATTIDSVAALVIEVVGSGVIVRGVEPSSLGRPRQAEVRHRIAHPGLGLSKFGFIPKVTLREGIKRTADAYHCHSSLLPTASCSPRQAG